MEDRIGSLLGLTSSGKRIYQVQESAQVDREEFQALQVIHQYVYGPKGLADTLGPTWDMIHDPRFEQIERVFIRKRQARFGGDATTGINKQMADGSFNSSVDDLNQYGEVLGEGRHFVAVLRSMAYHKAIGTLFPERQFKIPRGEYLPGLFVYNRLEALDQAKVYALASTYTEFYPKNLVKQPDDAIWALIKQECPNYWSRDGKRVNQVGKDLFGMLKADLVGLISDYAEIAKVQEWVLLDQEHTLVEQEHIDEELPRVWLEIEMLEKALTLRAELRSSATTILKDTGLEGMLASFEVKLTEMERETLLKLVYQANYPDDAPMLITSITGFLAGIKITGLTYEEREAQQCAVASEKAKAYVARLKSGEEKPINRETDGTEEIEMSEEDLIVEQIMLDPRKQMVFIRLSNAESRITKLRDRELLIALQIDEGRDAEMLPQDVMALTAERTANNEKISALREIVKILSPVFETSDFDLTEEAAADLLMQCEAFDSTVRAVVTDDQSEQAAPAEVEATT